MVPNRPGRRIGTTTLVVLVVVAVLATPTAATPLADAETEVGLSVDAPESVERGEAIRVRATVENEKSFPVTKVLTIEGPTSTHRKQVRLPAFGDASVTTLVPTEDAPAGTHELTVRVGKAVRTVTVAVEGDALPPTLRTVEVPSGQRTEIDLSIDLETDRIVVSGTHDPALGVRVEGVTNGSLVVETGDDAGTTVAIGDADRPTLTVSVAPEAPAGTTVRTSWVASSGDVTQAIAVEVVVVESDALAPYRGPDGEVGTDDLRAAIEDWASGELEIGTLREVIRAWASS